MEKYLTPFEEHEFKPKAHLKSLLGSYEKAVKLHRQSQQRMSRDQVRWTIKDLKVFLHALIKRKQMRTDEIKLAIFHIQRMEIKREHYHLYEKWQIGRHLNFLTYERSLD